MPEHDGVLKMAVVRTAETFSLPTLNPTDNYCEVSLPVDIAVKRIYIYIYIHALSNPS